MIIATIGHVQVEQDPETLTVTWESGSDVDADGANGQAKGPFAYRFDNRGLDVLADAGWPNSGWRNVFEIDASGHPKTDGRGNIYSKTSYMPPVDAYDIPYAVVNPIVRLAAKGIILGCHAVISYRNRIIQAVVADVGPENKIGEMSIAAARALGIPDSPRTGGVDSGVSWYLYPGSPAIVDRVTYELRPA